MPVAKDKPVYNISVVADLVGVHPRTLRIYEEAGLVHPARSRGNTRLYSESDIERLLHVRRLIEEIGLNVAGVKIILRIEERIGILVDDLLRD